jgi:hypothetical protein
MRTVLRSIKQLRTRSSRIHRTRTPTVRPRIQIVPDRMRMRETIGRRGHRLSGRKPI